MINNDSKLTYFEKKFNLFVYIIFSFIPVSFILGNTVLNINIIFCAILLILYSIIKKNWSWVKNELFIYLLIIWIYLIFNSLYAIFFKIDHEYIYGGIIRSLGYIKFVIFSCSFLLFINKNLKFQRIINVWFLIVSIILVDVFFEKIFGRNIIGNISPDHTRIVSFFKDELVAGSFLFCFGFLTTLYLYNRNDTSVTKKNLYFILLFIITLAIFITGERSNFIKSIIFFSILLIILPSNKLYINKKIIFVLILASITTLIFFDKNINQKYNEFFDRVNVSSNKGINKFENIKYFSHYNVAIEIFKDNVFFGVGNKNFRWECHMEKYFDASEKYSPQRCSTHPHQVHFELLSEHGLIGYLLIVYLLLKFIFPVFRDSNQDNIYIRKCLVYFLLVFLLPIIPSGSLFSTFNGSYFWLIISILNYLKEKNKINLN